MNKIHFQADHISARHSVFGSYYKYDRCPELDVAGCNLLQWLLQQEFLETFMETKNGLYSLSSSGSLYLPFPHTAKFVLATQFLNMKQFI